jgi:hypothetical protein
MWSTQPPVSVRLQRRRRHVVGGTLLLFEPLQLQLIGILVAPDHTAVDVPHGPIPPLFVMRVRVVLGLARLAVRRARVQRAPGSS